MSRVKASVWDPTHILVLEDESIVRVKVFVDGAYTEDDWAEESGPRWRRVESGRWRCTAPHESEPVLLDSLYDTPVLNQYNWTRAL